jgi:hypothetical protein
MTLLAELRFPLVAVLLLSVAPFATSSAAAQDPLGWNSARALELIGRARVRRDLPRGDSTLLNYTAKASGFVYFYLDRRDTEERTLVKVDQIALELYWKNPDRSKQRIVGLRDVSRLPNKMRYHLDHLTVVQNGFGDVIKVGDGDEVRDVPHPAAPGADSIYDYRLADSVTLQLGGQQAEVRVYELQVRPKRTNRSALIGSVFVDRASADIVRMTFTFTPASYVDRRLDYINISLDNGLFANRYWLPAEQSVEIRRQLPELDFAAGAVIKGRVRVANYQFNQALSDTLFLGREVSAVPPAQRQAFPFDRDIYSDVSEEGLAATPRMEELQELAKELVGQPRLSGLPSWRLYVPNASSVGRYNRTEGWYAGIGVTYTPAPTFRTDITGGYAFGAERPELTLSVMLQRGDVDWRATTYYNQPRDVGPLQAVPGVFNTFSASIGDRDYTDLYFTRGVALRVSGTRGNWRPGGMLRMEQHRRGFAPRADLGVAVVEEGNAYEAALTLERPLGDQAGLRTGAQFSLGYVYFDEAENGAVRFLGAFDTRYLSTDTRSNLNVRFDAGLHTEWFPAQYSFLFGGRGTLPGYQFRSLKYQGFLLTRAELAHTIAFPYVRARLLGNYLIGVDIAPEDDIVGLTDVAGHSSYGAGVGLLWDVIRVDFMKGRHWQTVFSVRTDFWGLL